MRKKLRQCLAFSLYFSKAFNCCYRVKGGNTLSRLNASLDSILLTLRSSFFVLTFLQCKSDTI